MIKETLSNITSKVTLSTISVRKVVAILITVVFCYLSIIGRIEASEFIPIFSMIMGYYFGKSTALDVPSVTNGNTATGNVLEE